MSSPGAWERFQPLAAPNLDRGCQAIVSALAVQTSRGWVGVAVTVVLGPADAGLNGIQGPRIVDALGFRAFRGSVPPGKVQGLLAGMQTGLVAADVLPEGVDVDLDLTGRDGRAITFYEPQFRKRNENQFGYPYPYHLIEGVGDLVGDVASPGALGQLSEYLPTAEHPFAGLSDLSAELQLGGPPEERSSRKIHVISPIWVGWDSMESSIATGELALKIHSFWSNLGHDLVLSAISRPERAPPWRVRSIVGDRGWDSSAEDGVYRFSTVLKANGSVPPADLHLSYRGVRLDTIPVGLGSVRTIAHAVFDADFDSLRRRLSNPKTTEAFEEGIAWLLHLCGFSAARYGHKDMQGAVDVVAFRDDSIAIFAEATSKIPPVEKIIDLRNRADAFQRRVKEARGVSVVLCRCMFVGVSREALSDEMISRAHDETVVLVANEDIDDLLEGALRGESATRAWGRLANCGPKFAGIHLE